MRLSSPESSLRYATRLGGRERIDRSRRYCIIAETEETRAFRRKSKRYPRDGRLGTRKCISGERRKRRVCGLENRGGTHRASLLLSGRAIHSIHFAISARAIVVMRLLPRKRETIPATISRPPSHVRCSFVANDSRVCRPSSRRT